MRGVLLLLMLALAPLTARGAAPADVESGKAAFWRGDFGASAAAYARAVVAHPENPDLWFNLGTAEARAERFGPAFHAFEQALRLAPEHADAAHNLSQIRTQVIQRALAQGSTGRMILPGEDDLGTGLLTAVLPRTLALIFTASWVFLFACLWFARRTTLSGRKTSLVFAAVLMGLVAVGAGGLLMGRMGVVDESTYGVVVADRADAHQGPGDHYPSVVKVLAGVKVRISGRDRDWDQIVLPDGAGAWLPRTALRRLQ
jgi:hypothetical protein